MGNYFCEIIIKLKFDLIYELLLVAIDLLDYEPNRMDIFYNEFKKSKDFILYDRNYIVENLSKSEVDGGITSLTLYNKNYTREVVTPFFRFRINDSTLNEDLISCHFEWVAYSDLDWLLNDELILSKLLTSNVELVYLLAYNQDDVYQESRDFKTNSSILKLFKSNGWGRREIVGGISFMAAPIMYFGMGYNPIIQLENLLKYEKSELIKINQSEIVRIKIFNLYSDPKHQRTEQEKFWKKINLFKEIEKYKDAKKIDFAEFLRKRSLKNKMLI